MVARSPARYLAPFALLAVLAATIIVIQANSGHASPAAAPARTRAHVRLRRSRPPSRPRSSYVVQAGDTYSAIAAKTGVPVSTLEALNPGIDPTALQTGERLRLH